MSDTPKSESPTPTQRQLDWEAEEVSIAASLPSMFKPLPPKPVAN